MSKFKEESQATLCAWNDYGESCGHRGILSLNTNGTVFYCRQHFYKLMGYPDMEKEGLHGNQLLKTPLHSWAVDEMRKRLK